MRKLYLLLCLLFFSLSLNFSNEITDQADILDHNGQHQEALTLLLSKHDKQNPNLGIIWRIGMQSFEASNLEKDKKAKLKIHEAAINITKPFIDINYGEKRERIEIIYWYAVNYASKMKLLGIFGGRESMRIVPEIFKLMDKCYAIDPAYPGTYFFIAKLHNEVPFFLGGKKALMDINYYKTLKYSDNKTKLLFSVEAGMGFLGRNWSLGKKLKEINKLKNANKDIPSFSYSDKDYANLLFKEAIDLFKTIKNPSQREKNMYNIALKLYQE